MRLHFDLYGYFDRTVYDGSSFPARLLVATCPTSCQAKNYVCLTGGKFGAVSKFSPRLEECSAP